MEYAANDFADIAARRKALRREMGLPDEDWLTAAGSDLDAVAATHGLYRNDDEYDYVLRGRIEAEINKF